MKDEAHHHRPTLKQKNKPFKSKHATKSSLKEASKGRISRISPKAQSLSSAAQTRLNRRNAAKQAQQTKRAAILTGTRFFHGVDGPPRIVAVVPLCPDVSAAAAARVVARALDVPEGDCPEHGTWKLRAEKFKTNLQLILLPYRQLYAALDACKAADYVIFVLSADVEVDPWGDLALRCLQAQGLPEVVTVAQSAEPLNPKSRTPILKSLLSFIQYFVPSQSKVHDISAPSGSDGINVARSLCEGVPGAVRWRDGRMWMLSEELGWDEGEEENKDMGTLKVTGVVRGAPLSANRLIHIPNYGDFQIAKAESIPSAARSRANGMDTDTPAPVFPSEDDCESLTSRLDPDTMANEQTWPTEEEMQGLNGDAQDAIPEAKKGTTPRRIRKVPKGTSTYQAAWIIDDDDDDNGEGGNEDEESGSEMVSIGEVEEEEKGRLGDNDDDMEEGTEERADLNSRKSVAFMDLDDEEEEKQHRSWLDSRKREDEDDAQFPDEIDTPKDVAARERFARYRGLRSFRTSPWDPYESLPLDYGRIFQFEDYERTKRNVMRRANEEGIEAGRRVIVHIKNVPRQCALSHDPIYPFVIFGLLQHEHKVSVLHFAVQRNTECDDSVRSKDPLTLCIGPRRFRTNPVFSQHLRGGGKGVNNVHKFERYLRHGGTSVATTYGPIVFGKQPCMFLKETDDPQAPHLIAMGTFLSPDPKRIIAKRIILTGHPFKVHKRTATIRYMFFNLDDISYFAPIQLHTKYGRTGHIRESLGTHGYFKAHFDGPVSQMDTVCLSLYKRVYPKWGELWREEPRATISEIEDVTMEE